MKIEFKGRKVEFPYRYKLIKDGTEELVELIRDVGEVYEKGTQLGEAFFEQLKKEFLSSTHKVGDIYTTTTDENPSEYFGGSWERFAEGRMLIGAGTSDASYTLGIIGGASTVALTGNELPSHNHSNTTYYSGETMPERQVISRQAAISSTSSIKDLNTGFTGGGQAHNNMPPYIVVNIWRKTAEA